MIFLLYIGTLLVGLSLAKKNVLLLVADDFRQAQFRIICCFSIHSVALSLNNIIEDSSSLFLKPHPDPILVSTTRQTLLSSTRHTWSLHIWTGHQEDKEDACPSSIIDNAGLRNEVWFSTKRFARRPCADPAEPPSSRAEGENGTNNSFEVYTFRHCEIALVQTDF